MQILQIMKFFTLVGSSIIGYTLHADYRQQKGQYTLHFCTEWLNEIFCVPSSWSFCVETGRGEEMFSWNKVLWGVCGFIIHEFLYGGDIMALELCWIIREWMTRQICQVEEVYNSLLYQVGQHLGLV